MFGINAAFGFVNFTAYHCQCRISLQKDIGRNLLLPGELHLKDVHWRRRADSSSLFPKDPRSKDIREPCMCDSDSTMLVLAWWAYIWGAGTCMAGRVGMRDTREEELS